MRVAFVGLGIMSKPMSRNFKPGFRIRLHQKDLREARAQAQPEESLNAIRTL